MQKDFMFFRCYPERETSDEGEPCLLAATEVVQAVCDAGFQKNRFLMRGFSSSPHCYYKYAKTPEKGMYMLRAVKKTDMTTLDILIDTRLYPCFVMIEKHSEWQEETKEVKDTLEQVINDDADKYNWHVNLQEYHTNTTQHLEEFIGALNYMYKLEDVSEKHEGNVQIGQLILKVNGNNYYNEEEKMSDVRSKMSDVRSKMSDERVEKDEERREECFHFIHPEIEDEEAWHIHDAMKRSVRHQGIQMICHYLTQLKNEKKVLLPPNPSAAYIELVRMGMPNGNGFNEKTFRKYYNK